MDISTLLVPGLLSITALVGMGRKINVYDTLTEGAREGLSVSIRILPALVGLLTAVYMFRASGAMEFLGGLLGPVLELVGIPPETAALLFIRPVSGGGGPGTGQRSYRPVRSRFLYWSGHSGDAGQHRDHLLHHRCILRQRRN